MTEFSNISQNSNHGVESNDSQVNLKDVDDNGDVNLGIISQNSKCF